MASTNNLFGLQGGSWITYKVCTHFYTLFDNECYQGLTQENAGFSTLRIKYDLSRKSNSEEQTSFFSEVLI